MLKPAGLVLDVETKDAFGGGRRLRPGNLAISLVGTYDYREKTYGCYREGDLQQLAGAMRSADMVIGFNLRGFDLPVLASELGGWVHRLKVIDLMLEVKASTGRRISLGALAQATLGVGKSGSGLDAIRFYQEGNWEELERYCLDDVRLTKELYEHALTHGCLYLAKRGRRTAVPMPFASSDLAKLFIKVCGQRGSVLMTYGGKQRVVDVFSFDGRLIRGYCHLRSALLTFRLDRVETATETDPAALQI